MRSSLEYTVTPLFQGLRPRPSGTWLRVERAQATVDSILIAQERRRNPDFLGVSLRVTTRSQKTPGRFVNDVPGVDLIELVFEPGERFPADLDALLVDAVLRLSEEGNRRERLEVEAVWPTLLEHLPGLGRREPPLAMSELLAAVGLDDDRGERGDG